MAKGACPTVVCPRQLAGFPFIYKILLGNGHLRPHIYSFNNRKL